MDSGPVAFSLTARWIFPVAGPPIAGGGITIRGERIVEVSERPADGAIDLGDVAILPGFVNAHTHLEFSDLTAPLGERGTPLPTWIRQVIAARGGRGADPASQMAASAAAISQGLAESARCGVTTLGEIATSGWGPAMLENAPLDLNVFYELIGLRADRVDERLADAEEFVTRALVAARWHGGLSPHAPYSVHPELLVGIARLAAANHLPLAMHVAESREELQLLATGGGPFHDLLQALGAWDPEAISLDSRPIDYLQVLALALRALVIHGNYLDLAERAFLAEHAGRMSLVYCPRTHSYFEHERYPLVELLSAGVRVAIGTDSRASNPDLSLLAELRHVAAKHPEIRLADVLELGTLAGAQALGQDHEVGSLTAGKLANLAIVPLASTAATDPLELVLHSNADVSATYYRGLRVAP
jgi:cytosine/adenosine deaminase-related metal-dependent hydrolase